MVDRIRDNSLALSRDTGSQRLRGLFICGGSHQTRQMHLVASALPECDAFFSPYYCDGALERIRRLGLIEFTILGWKRRKECLRYLRKHNLALDFEGKNNTYDLVVTCSDVVIPQNVVGTPIVAVQEGILDPKGIGYRARQLLPFLPRWAAGTALTGTSNLYDRFCVASDGYRKHFIELGADPDRVVTTGVPVLDDCERHRNNDFPLRDFVLVCTSDARETFKGDNRRRFIERAVRIAAGTQLVFKLHPNENKQRAIAEIARWAPAARIYTSGCAEEMVANCRVLICQYSTLAFVGLALGKEVHSYFDLAELHQLMPLQGGQSAGRIAQICRGLLHEKKVVSRAADGMADIRSIQAEAAMS